MTTYRSRGEVKAFLAQKMLTDYGNAVAAITSCIVRLVGVAASWPCVRYFVR